MGAVRYADVVRELNELAETGWKVTELATADGYSILALTDPLRGRGGGDPLPQLLIAAGIHGEEPAGVLGLVQWLKEHAPRWVGRLHMDVAPCLNPWGFERGVRYARNGEDLNRQFDSPRHPAVQAFVRWIAGRRFDLFMDLHEDSDFEAMYLYELLDPWPGHGVRTLGRRILDRAAVKVPLSDGDDVGDLKTSFGLIAGTLARREAAAFVERPVAIEVFAHHAAHVVTVETPGRAELDLRIRLQVDALETAAEHLANQSEAATVP